jgi:hypothetical protein
MKENFFEQNKNIVNSEKEIVDKEIESIKRENNKIEKAISLINENFAEDESFFIKKALYLAKEIHEDQLQLDGSPYIEHPVEVSMVIVEKFNIKDKDLFITALLHDSLEDQSEKLFANYIEKNNFFVNNYNILSLKTFSSKFSNEIKEIAFLEIRDNFGPLIAERVRRLSKPDFDGLIDSFPVEDMDDERKRIKNSMYKDYFKNVLDYSDNGVGVIKFADFFNNVSRNHLIEDQDKRKKLADKYGPVLKDVVVPFLLDMEESHPLYKESKNLLKIFEDIYRNDFDI